MFSRLCASLATAALACTFLPTPTYATGPAPFAPHTPLVSPVTVRPDTFAEENDQAASDLFVAINNFEPRVLTNESTLVISGVVANRSKTALSAPNLGIFMQSHTPISMAEMSHFFAGLLWNGPSIASVELAPSLAPGEILPFTVSVDRADLPLEGHLAWGPRGVTVEATAGDLSARDRSVVLWDSGEEYVPSRVNIVVPWTTTNSPLPVHAPAVAGQLQSIDAVTLAVDPEALNLKSLGSHNASMTRLVQTRILGGTRELIPLQPFDADSGLTSRLTTPWIHELSERTRTEFPSPLYAADPPGFSADSHADDSAQSMPSDTPHSGQPPQSDPVMSAHIEPDMGQSTRESENAGESALPIGPRIPVTAPVLDTVRWPSDESFDIDFLARSPEMVTIAPPGDLGTKEDIDFLPASRVEIDTVTGETVTHGSFENTATALSSPAYLSELLEWSSSTAADNLDRDQLLGAAGAIITRERPNVERSFIAIMPRRTQLTDDALTRIRALTDHRWLHATTLSSIIQSEPTDISRVAVEAASLADASQEAVAAVNSALERVSIIEASVLDPRPLRAELAQRSFESLSASFDPRQRRVAANLLRAKVDNYTTAIHAEASAPVNVISTSVNFPVRVVNDLPWDVRVRVDLNPSDHRMRVTEVPEVTIPAQSAQVVEVPVKAIGSGDINVTYEVSTIDGQLLDDGHSVSVRLRAEWEDMATITMALLIGIAFVGGLIRTIRRRMRTSDGLPGAGGSTPTDTIIPVSDASPSSAPEDTLADSTVSPPKDE